MSYRTIGARRKVFENQKGVGPKPHPLSGSIPQHTLNNPAAEWPSR